MRVAIVTESFYPTINGVSNSVARVLEFLESYGHQAIVIAPHTKSVIRSYAGFPIKHVPSFYFKQHMPVGIPRLAIRHLIEGFQPEVIHLASPALLGSYSSRIAQELRIPTLSVYQTDISGFARHYGVRLGNKAIDKYFAAIHNATDLTLAPSPSAVDHLRSLGVQRVKLWPRGVDLERFHPQKRDPALRQSWGAPRKLIVGYVGRLAQEKSLEDLAVLNSKKNIQVVIVGGGPAASDLKRVLSNAIFTGIKVGEELASHIASFDVFVHTGQRETFCQSIQEALASGVPAIAPRCGGPTFLINDGVNGYLYDPLKPAEIELKIRLIQDNTLESFEFAARESVSSRDWDTINRNLYKHYKSILHQTAQLEEAV